MLLLVAAPLCIFSYYIIKQKIVQVQMEEALEKTLLQTITIANAEVQWEEEGKEIIINGKMFDVKYFVINGDNIIVTGLYDDAETVLKTKVEKLLAHKNSTNTPLDNLVLKFLFTSALLPHVNSIQINNYFVKDKFYGNYKIILHLHNYTVETPPPNV